MIMEAKILTETRFLTVVDTYPGYCQVCHKPHVVGRIAVAGWEHHGAICSQCLIGLADEVQRRGKGLAVEDHGKTSSKGDVLASVLGSNGNGNGHARDFLRQ
jgi:hypothetical protein